MIYHFKEITSRNKWLRKQEIRHGFVGSAGISISCVLFNTLININIRYGKSSTFTTFGLVPQWKQIMIKQLPNGLGIL